ncbi:LuxR C-terminal-related transcriptional regulator [Reichenbachiella carrageenanivorans]|uniref:LuxR C-terminal-related transcriptional regulator n=1 Tax=Reichenbachiella carrageenanivorans TaxID=2979869 RepID=A0ABY6D492_9BACT|nr:7TM diverse intracellular signaling domain-containing protein [Reichenbachiella carrageenanivorans]UXX79938.1 LuxR C-terminal-related transcriptional regulator [Reichenbachiella carrageenanivorans]
MKKTKYIHLFFSLVGFLFFSSCSTEHPLNVDYSFEVAKDVEQSIDDFDRVKFESFDDLNLGFYRGNLWIKLEITNEENEDKSYMFVSNDRFNRNYVFYKLDTLSHSLKLVNQIKDTLRHDYRTFNNPNPNLKIDLEANEHATYLITSTSDGRTKDATPKIISIESYFDFINESTIWSIVFYGIIICLLLINIYQWTIYRKEIFLYYIFYIVSTLFVYLGIEGYLYGLRLDQMVLDHFIFVSVKLWALSLIMYTSKFLETQIVAPNYYKFIKVILVVVLGGILLYQFVFYHSSIQYLHYFENILSVLWLLLIIGILLFSAKSRWLELKYYLIPLACFIVFTVFGVVNVHLQIFAGNSFTYVKIGAIIELIGFTYFMRALIKRKLNQSEILEKTLKQKEELLASKASLVSVFKLIENTFSNEADWKSFKEKFERLNPNFISSLTTKYADLSKSEIRLLTLIRIGYSQKEIADILNIAPESVKKSRSRARRKLNLPDSVTLKEYLLKL